jgi:hypothetical protein
MMRALVPGVEHVADQHRVGCDDGGDHSMLDSSLGMVRRAVPEHLPRNLHHTGAFAGLGKCSFLSAT